MNVPHFTSDAYVSFANNHHLSQSMTQNMHSASPQNMHKNNSSASKNIPWKKTEQYTCGVIGLHEEINDFYEVMKPTEQESEVRLKVIEHITRVVHSQWPQAKVEVFGSFRTGLYLPSSDIDMVIFGSWKRLPLSTLGNALEQNGIDNSDINIIAGAKVPILKMIHTPSKIRVDISFNVKNGVDTAKLLKKLIQEHPALPKLVMVLKQFLVHRGLNEVYSGGMSSYCLTLLIISYLQDCHRPKCTPSTNLGTMLIEFFEHYGQNFNYEYVSIHFQHRAHYKPRGREANNLLNVEDPIQKGFNVAKGTYLMHLLKMAFQNAFLTLSKAVTDSSLSRTPHQSFLSLILGVDEETLQKRTNMQINAPVFLRKMTRLLNNPCESSFPFSSTPLQRPILVRLEAQPNKKNRNSS